MSHLTHHRRAGRFGAILLLAVFLAGCSGDKAAQSVSKAQDFYAKGDYKAASIELKNAVQNNPENKEARTLLGRVHVRLGDGAAGEKELRRAIELGVPKEQVLVDLGRALLLQRAFDKVLEEIPARPGGAPADAALLLTLRAEAQLARQHLDDAVLSYEEARRLDPDSIEALRGLAVIALTRNESETARRLADEAIQKSPERAEPWVLKGDLLRAEGKFDEARAAYEEAIKRKPEFNTHLALAALHLRDKRFDAAQQSIDAARKLEPAALQLRLVQGQLYFAQQKFPEARDQLQEVLKVAPNLPPALLLMGATQHALGANEQAETYLASFVKAVPDNAYARTLLASTYIKTKQPDKALDAIKPLLAGDPPNPAALALAGEAHMQRKEPAKAAEYLEKAAKIVPQSAGVRTELALSRLAAGDVAGGMGELEAAVALEGSSTKTDLALITAYLARREYDKALAAIASLEKKDPNNPLVHNLRGGAYVGKNDVANARKAFEKALALDAAYYPAAANLAQLDMRDKNPQAARSRFERVLAANKTSVPAMMGLAALERQAGKEQAMLDWLNKATAADPKALAPRSALVQYHIGKNAPQQALAIAREAQTANPGAPEAMELLGLAQLAAGEKDNAVVTFTKLVEMAPRAPGAHVRLASAQLARDNLAEARKAFGRALELDPNHVDAQLGLIQVDLREQRSEDALRRARQLQSRHPNAPGGYMVEGDILAGQKEYAKAAAAYQRAFDLAKSGLLVAKLHGSLAAAGKRAEAEAKAAQWLKEHPEDLALRAYLADHYLRTAQNARAIAEYEAILKTVPDHLLALNNLAWLYQESRDARALATAERAYKLMPDSPNVMDTLGWVLVQQGDAKRGLGLLQQAYAKAPDHPSIHYHLAVALAKTGDRAKAQSELDRLLARGAKFPEEQQARALFEQLKSGR